MGEADRYGEYKPPRKRFILGQDGNALVGLFTLNVIFFLAMLTIQVVYFFFQADKSSFYAQVVPYFELPAQLSSLAKHPWTILSFMFTHVGVMHMISNMLWLWGFGYVLQELTGDENLFPIYIYGGLFGAAFFITANYGIPPLRPYVNGATLIGANASTMSIAVAATTLAPSYRFFRNLNGGIPIWVLMLIYVLIDMAGISSMSAAHSLSHLGGGLAGFIFIALLRKDINAGSWMNRSYSWFMNLFNPAAKRDQRSSVKEKVFYNTGNRNPYKKTAHITQQRIDEILDKINQKGYHLLTEEEKNILKRASEEDL